MNLEDVKIGEEYKYISDLWFTKGSIVKILEIKNNKFNNNTSMVLYAVGDTKDGERKISLWIFASEITPIEENKQEFKQYEIY